MIWDDPAESEYPGVRAYLQKIKRAIMEAHDSIIGARVKQTRDANKKRRPSPFVNGDLIEVRRALQNNGGLRKQLISH